MIDSGHDPADRVALPAGYDGEDPYAETDLDDLPQWWQRNIEEFRAYELRPYRPPQFADGELVPSLVTDLEEEHDISIQLRVIDPQEGQDWKIMVGSDPVATVERFRHSKGYSVCNIESEQFEQLVLNAID